jgi:hypothetical protein
VATNLTALFETKFDGSGATAAKAGFAGWQDGITKANNASKTLGTNYESMAEKLGKPIAKVAYRNVAMEAVAMSGALTGAGAAASGVTQVLSGVGSALIYIQPQIAMAAIAMVGLMAVYKSVSGTRSKNIENTRAHSEALVRDAESARKSAEALKSLGAINDDLYTRLINVSSAKEKELSVTREQIKKQVELADTYAESMKREKEASETMHGSASLNSRRNYNAALEKQAELEKALIAIGETSAGVADRQNQSLAAQKDLRNLQTVAISQQQSQTMTMNEAVMALMDTEIRRSELENQFINTNSPKKAEAIQKEIDGINALASAYESQISKLQTIQKAEESVMKQRAAIILRYMAPVESSWEMHGKKLVFNARKFLAEELRLVAEQAKLYLAYAAAKYFHSGNIAMGTLALAGIAAVSAISGSVSTLLGGGGSEAESSPSVGSTSSPSLSDSVGNETTQASRPMNINIQVNALHAGTAEQLGVQLVKLINTAQDVAGASLKATTLQTGGSWMAT